MKKNEKNSTAPFYPSFLKLSYANLSPVLEAILDIRLAQLM